MTDSPWAQLRPQQTPVAPATRADGPGPNYAGATQPVTAYPDPFKQKIGAALVAQGRSGSSPNSMRAGAALLGAASPGELLKDVLAGFNGEIKVLRLPAGAREDLGRILAASGLESERIGPLLAGLGTGEMKLDKVYQTLAKADLSGRGRGPGLVATEAGVADLGQFLAGLGASTEVVDQALSGLTPGEAVTGRALREIFAKVDIGGLERDLRSGDLRSLVGFMQNMGARPGDLEKLGALLAGTEGQLPTSEFLQFLDGLKEGPAQSVTGQELELVKKILANIER